METIRELEKTNKKLEKELKKAQSGRRRKV